MSKYTASDRERLIKLVIEGKTYREIAKETGIPESTISHTAARYGHRRYGIANCESVAALAMEGLSRSEIAARLEVSTETVRRVARENGIEVKTNVEMARIPDSHLDLVRSALCGGMSQMEVGRVYGVCQTTVSMYLKKRGVKAWGREQYHKINERHGTRYF